VSPPRSEACDAIVVGGGLGGLSAAAFLARTGATVALVERAARAGGCARAIRRGPYLFDPALGHIPQGTEGELRDGILAHLGVADRCTLLPLDDCYGVRFPGLELHTPPDLGGLADAHAELFPAEARSFRRFFELCREILEAAHRLPLALSFRELDRAAERFPAFFKYRSSTLGDVLDEHFTDPRARALCGGLWPYLGLPPSSASFATYAQLVALMARGLYYCRGSFQELADAFVAALESLGGEVLLGRDATRILVEDGRAAGVRLDDGREIRAPVVVSNADASHTFDRLVGRERLPKPFLRRLGRMRRSLSGFVLLAATTADMRALGAASENFLHTTFDHEDAFQASRRGVPTAAWVSVPTLVDPSLAPPGEHVVVARTLVEYDVGEPWEQAEERCTESVLGLLDRSFGGLRDGLRLVEAVTPPQIEESTGNGEGALYGWEHSPAHTASRRLAQVTPIPGLYLSGHWTQPGAGAYRAILSGMHVARAILARSGKPEAIPDFRSLDA
jgi:phytoene dehydrogenase-like protein